MPKKQGVEYEAQIPPFLARLKAGHAERGGRHEVAVPRVRGGKGGNERLRMDDDEEDAPVVVCLDGDAATVQAVAGERDLEGEHRDGLRGIGRKEGDAVNITSGFGRKRKIVRVIGDERPDDGDCDDGVDVVYQAEPVKSMKQSTEELSVVVEERKAQAEAETSQKMQSKPMKKKNKIKLSFDEVG